MTTILQTIYTEMLKGNFSFAILLVGIFQIIIMIFNIYFIVKQYRASKHNKQQGDNSVKSK